ncbi:putative C-type lectin domain family 20 member A isoform X2 [Mesocricetus auratus]|uniref:C-type lectin domain family 20 member A isoform X2 n=1 Tax=Mesocricetus auratus TaxID=10036 RepID=A0ABM2X226_MESAU|nr:putative C-type lectin domain family 20 member A isoform X2 [Mesocricetus auratus]
MSWLSALIYCRNHYTDLADLQKVTDKEGIETLHYITNDVDAWIGLYFNVKTNNLTWSSNLGSSIPEWLQKIPVFGQGLCAGLRIFSNAPPQIYTLFCHELKPFICFWDPSIGHRKLAEMPLLTDTSSPKVTHPSEVTTRTTSRPNTGTRTGPQNALQTLVSATWIRQQVSHEAIGGSSDACGFGICDTTTPVPTTMGLTALQPQGTVSLSPLVTSAPSGEMYTPLEERAGGEGGPSREKSPATMKDGTQRGEAATATQAQHVSSPKHPESKEKPVANSALD